MRHFGFKEALLAVGLLSAGSDQENHDKKPPATGQPEIFDVEKDTKERSGQSVLPEIRELPPYFVSDNEALENEFARQIKNLPEEEKSRLLTEWQRVACQEEKKMYRNRFNGQDFFVQDFFNPLIKNENLRQEIGEAAAKAVAEYQIPPEIILGMIGVESGGNPKARSKSKPSARGILQLVPDTAREMGLKVELNAEDEVMGVDERYDIAKNVDAGARYLKLLKEKFGSWGLAMVAFCEGPTQLGKQLNRFNVPADKRSLVHLYSKRFYNLGKVHPFQYPFHVQAMTRQMLEIMNEGKILPMEGKKNRLLK